MSPEERLQAILESIKPTELPGGAATEVLRHLRAATPTMALESALKMALALRDQLETLQSAYEKGRTELMEAAARAGDLPSVKELAKLAFLGELVEEDCAVVLDAILSWRREREEASDD